MAGPRILFYTFTPRAFRTTLIYHLYELAREYPVVLLSEKLDPETERVITEKSFFPGLEAVIPVRQFTGEPRNALRRNRELANLARDAVRRYRPDIVVTANDVCLFEAYLLREAKQRGALAISLQSSLMWKAEYAAKLVELTNAYAKLPSALPFPLRLLIAKCKKYAGHFGYYWGLPLLAGRLPFPGKSSLILWKGADGMRDADYQIAFDRRHYDFHVHNGVDPRKLRILPHPLTREKNRLFFEKNFGEARSQGGRSISVMYPAEIIGFRKRDMRPISRDAIYKMREEVITLVADILKSWDIVISPHPDTGNVEELRGRLLHISPRIQFKASAVSADKFIAASDAMLGFPPASTTLYMTSVQKPDIPIISVNFFDELSGDYYRDFEGVEYVTRKDRLLHILSAVRDGRYRKTPGPTQTEGFRDTVEMVRALLPK